MRRDSDRERQVRPRYDGMAAWYDSFVRSTEMTRVALDSLVRLLGNGPGRCLDLGCGTGIAFETLAQLGWTLVGVDVSADQLSVAANVASPAAVELVRADAECLPFRTAPSMRLPRC